MTSCAVLAKVKWHFIGYLERLVRPKSLVALFNNKDCYVITITFRLGVMSNKQLLFFNRNINHHHGYIGELMGVSDSAKHFVFLFSPRKGTHSNSITIYPKTNCTISLFQFSFGEMCIVYCRGPFHLMMCCKKYHQIREKHDVIQVFFFFFKY